MKADLFKFFDEMNKGNFSYVDSLSDDEVKSLSPFVLLMWMHGAQQNKVLHTLLTDWYCNVRVFSLSKHPRLLLKLFVAANGDIDSTRYKFKKSTGNEATKNAKAVAGYYQCSLSEAKDYLRILTKEDVKEIVEIYEMREKDG